jgi:signal transduction histidine kinase
MTLLLELAAQPHDSSKSNGNGNGHLREGLAVARQTIKALDETVWAVNPRNNTLAELIGYIGQFAMEFLQHANIRCQLDLPDEPPDWPVSFELRHNLFLMVKESVNNVVRHAQASEVQLKIAVTENELTLLIADNGRGFDRLPEDALADGVRNMRQRAEELGGRFQIESKPGGGTRVSVVCSLQSKNGETISS